MRHSLKGSGLKQQGLSPAASPLAYPCPAQRGAHTSMRTPGRRQARRTPTMNVATPDRSTQTKGQNNTKETSLDSSLSYYHSIDHFSAPTSRPRVVVLGSGWGAMSFMKSLPKSVKKSYDIVVVSPRNYFLYTPLLPAVATGTMEERSIVEPVRKIVNGKGDYYEAVCKDIDPVRRELVCCFPGMDSACFKVAYDVLVLAVGCTNNTFGIQGVEQYCNFFKSIEDAHKLRRRVSECFERAALPACPEEERRRLLSFMVVGGGPTGVEVAAELYDMITDDLIKLYPSLKKEVSIQIVELTDHLLSTYDRAISKYTAENFKRAGIKVLLNTRLDSVQHGSVTVVAKDGTKEIIPFGACVWATGIAMNPIAKLLQEKLPEQRHARSILTDEILCVKGSHGSIFALGDAASIDQPKALQALEQLWAKAEPSREGTLSISQVKQLLVNASSQFPHLREHAEFLACPNNLSRTVTKLMHASVLADDPMWANMDGETRVTKDQFKQLITKIDSGMRALPATAQVAKQQGEFLARLFTKGRITGWEDTNVLPKRAFLYSHKGSTAYVGRDMAVFDMPHIGSFSVTPLTGFGAGLAWKGFETYSQISFRNQCLVATDWLRTKIFGRDISNV